MFATIAYFKMVYCSFLSGFSNVGNELHSMPVKSVGFSDRDFETNIGIEISKEWKF